MPAEDPPNAPWQRVLTAVGTALLVDAADLVTFGPLGLWTGLLLGGLLGWHLAPQLGFSERRRLPAAHGGSAPVGKDAILGLTGLARMGKDGQG